MSADDEARLRQEGDRIEALLAELGASAGPQTWPRVEELVSRMLALYGAALERLLLHARASGANDLDARLSTDELVSSLLLVHGLHPLDAKERVRRALDRARPYLGSHGGDVALVAVEGDTATLSLSGSCDGCPSSRDTIEGLLRQAIEADAPEITRIEIAGALVPLGQKTKRTRWEAVSDLDGIAPEAGRTIHVGGGAALVLHVGGALLAYRDACPSCGIRLDAAMLRGDALACACGRSYDVARGGRAHDGQPPHLTPLPLLVKDGRHRLGLPEVGP